MSPFRPSFLAMLLVVLGGGVAWGCPMCQIAAEADPRLPQAIQYGILLMLAVPMMLFSGFTWAFWRLSRQARVTEPLPEQDVTESAGDSGPVRWR